jgi:hypothetical protein
MNSASVLLLLSQTIRNDTIVVFQQLNIPLTFARGKSIILIIADFESLDTEKRIGVKDICWSIKRSEPEFLNISWGLKRQLLAWKDIFLSIPAFSGFLNMQVVFLEG